MPPKKENVKTFEDYVRSRGFRVRHQTVNVELDLQQFSIKGSTELEILPLKTELPFIRVHCRQCSLLAIKVNDVPTNFLISDDAYHGEVMIFIPKDSHQPKRSEILRVEIEYELEKPQGGVHYVQHNDKVARHLSPHIYTINQPAPGATRLWLPCIDHLWDRCTWDLNYTISDFDNYNITVISNGRNLDEDVNNQVPMDLDQQNFPKTKTFRYKLDVPAPAQYIGFAAGPFEYVELPHDDPKPNLPKIIGYYLPGRKNILESTFGLDIQGSWKYINRAMKFFTDEYHLFHVRHLDLTDPQPMHMPGSFPYDSYKMIFVDNTYSPVVSLAGLSICSTTLLHPGDVIDQVYETRVQLVQALAAQWFGTFILPSTRSDVWLTLGLANYFGFLFLTKLMGSNDTRFRVKKSMERVCQIDVGRPPLLNREPPLTFNQDDLDFMRLKGQLVLYELDKRLRKSGYNVGLPGIISQIIQSFQDVDRKKISLSTKKFMEECQAAVPERYDQIKRYFQQWIHGSGCPQFDIKYTFNRKKMVVEFQVIQQNTNAKNGKIGDAVASGINPTPLFTGPMLVCVHEADGKSYEHVLSIQGSNEKHVVPFHTKYKRIRRTGKKNQKSAKHAVPVEDPNVMNGHSALESWGYKFDDDEKSRWCIVEWDELEEKKENGSDVIEWIRVDEDFGWICTLKFNQFDFMWASQLHRDIDVLAQYEAIQNLSTMPSRPVSGVLLQVLKDETYYCKVRVEASFAMAKCVNRQKGERGEIDIGTTGLDQLIRYFKEQYCFSIKKDFIPKPNDFSNISEYFVRKAVVSAIANVKSSDSNSSKDVTSFLLRVLQYNDNTGNKFSDNYYVAALLVGLANALTSEKNDTREDLNEEVIYEDPPDNLNEALQELERYRWRDILFPSYKNTVTVAYIQALCNLMLSLPDEVMLERRSLFFKHTLYGHCEDVRLAGLQAFVMLDSWRTRLATDYITELSCLDPSLYVRRQLMRLMKFEDLGPCAWSMPKQDPSSTVVYPNDMAEPSVPMESDEVAKGKKRKGKEKMSEEPKRAKLDKNATLETPTVTPSRSAKKQSKNQTASRSLSQSRASKGTSESRQSSTLTTTKIKLKVARSNQ